MNIDAILNNDGYHVPNPNYKKGNGEPKFVISDDPRYAPRTSAGMFFESAQRGDLNTIGTVDEYRKYIENGITPREGDNPRDYEKVLAANQPILEKARNSLIQTISEATLGTVKAFADLFDLVTLSQMQKDNDYQNPISTQLEKWQKQIRESLPIHQNPDVNILNGGLFDSSFIFAGLPSVVSSLTLLVPSKAVSYGITRGASWVTRNGLKFARNMERAHKAAQLGDAAEGASTVAKVNAYINGPASRTAKNIIDYGIGGLTSRLLENYQESRQTYDDSKPVYNEILKGMSEDEREKTINDLKSQYGEKAADWNSNDSVSSLIARKAADETFKIDLANVFSDIYQMYAIGKVGRALNGPSRSALNRLNKFNIKTAGMSKEAVDKLLSSRTTWMKAKDKLSDFFYGGKSAIISELAEGAEEAVNYIAQEEGFHYGKVLLNQEAAGNFWSDRLIDYAKNPQLWDSAFWGLAGGVIFNKTGEYANRFTQARDKIRQAKKALEETVDENAKKSIKIPTFREAFRDTELMVRKANLESNAEQYRDTQDKLNRIQNGEDIFHITKAGKLETQEEKDAAKELVIRQFRDKVILDSMDAGNYDLAKEYLASDELKQAFIDGGHLSKEQADIIQTETLSRGDELLHMYNKNLRRLYNAVADWGENNDADLTEMPAEIFNIIARENIDHELSAQYHAGRIARLERANAILEKESEKELEKAAKENGINDFKSVVEQVYKAQQLGIINAEIADLKAKKQHTTASGQAILRTLEANKKLIQEELEEASGVNIKDAKDVQTAVNLLLTHQAASSVELMPFNAGEQHTYQVNEANANFLALADAIQKRDRKVIAALSPAMEAILNRNPTKEGEEDVFLRDVINLANTRNQIIKNLYDNKGNMKVLQNINAQLESNYKEIVDLKLNQAFEESRINTTKDKIKARAHDILNSLKDAKGFLIGTRASSLDTASHLYQQLAKKYGKEEIMQELDSYVKTGKHTPVFSKFNNDEQSTFESITAIVKLNRPENDIALGDIYKALNYNDIYEYSKDTDVVELIKESRRKRQEAAAQNSSASQNSNLAGQNQGSNNQSSGTNTQTGGAVNGQNGGQNAAEVPLEDGEVGEGRVDVEDDNRHFHGSDVANLTDEQIAEAISTIEQYNQDPNHTQEERDIAAADLQALMAEQANRAANATAPSSTGEQAVQLTLDRSDVVAATKAIVEQLSESNPENIDVEGVRNQIKSALAQQFTDVEDDVLTDLVDSSIAIVDRKLRRNGESIETALAKNAIKLSRVAANNKSDAAVREAKTILNQTFDDLLDIFNRHLSKGKINGKYIIPLEALLRYARNITSNEFDAQEMYDTFTKLIAENPDKYTTIQGKPIVQSKAIQNITESVSKRRAQLDSNFGGRTFNINGLLNSLSEENKKKVREAVKTLRPGSKIYVEANYKNEKLMDKKEGMFIGGIDFIVVDAQGNKVKIASAPTPMYTNNGGFGEMQEGWYYQFPFGEEQGKKEYPIQTFFKTLFTSDNEKAKKFVSLLRQYEALTAKEAFDDEIGGKIIKEAYKALEDFAKDINFDLDSIVQSKKINIDEKNFKLIPINTDEAKADRIRHLAKLDVYTQDRWNLDVEDLNYETDENDIDLMNESYKQSIDNWFNKMVESSEARDYITKRLDKLPDGTYDVGVEIESVNNPTLIVTKEENALPVSKAIAEQHKDNIHLAAGPSPNDRSADKSKVMVSNGEPISLGGVNTVGRSVVIIDTPDGNKTHINAYPVQVSNALFKNNVKLAAFKEALETRLDELMDEWYRTRNSEDLEAFLDMLGHKTTESRKIGGSLFVGFTRTTLPKGNGFSIAYKRVNGKIVPPGSREDGETHFLTFYDTVPTTKGVKARAAVQDYTRSRVKNPAVVWNSTPTDTSTLADFKAMKAIVREVIIDSLKIRIDSLNINADNTPNMSYGAFMTRDKDGNFALKVSGIVNPGNNLKQYAQSNGDIVITGLGRNGAPGTFSDFISFNDLVSLTTRQIDGSNFSVFDQADGDFGITYTVKRKSESSPVEKVEVIPAQETQVPLSNVIKDIINKNNGRQNTSKAIIKAIVDRIADSNGSLYKLTKNSEILRRLLHKNVIFVENFNGAKYVMPDGTTEVIPDDAYAAYIPDNGELKLGDKTVKLEKGQIVVGDRFMELLDGDTGDIIDALHHILHENIHGFIADNDSANPELNARYKKELNDIWDEFTRKHPTSPHAKTAEYNDLEEFLVESLTNPDLIRELNDTIADEPLSNPKKPKSLLGKLFDKLINWLSDILGKDFKVNKDSLFAKEYAIFEETISQPAREQEGKKVVKHEQRGKKEKPANIPVEGTLDFKEDEPGEETESTPEIDNFTLAGPSNRTQSQDGNVTINQDDRTRAPKRRGGPRASTIASHVPTLRGALDNLDGETYFDIKEKINNGVISIKCN